ncbi:MAG: hypothetical protein ACK5LY_02010 [Lachnospirales bacterium]
MFNLFYIVQILALVGAILILFIYKMDSKIYFKISSASMLIVSTLFILLEFIYRNEVTVYSTDSLINSFNYLEKSKYTFTFVFWILNLIAFIFVLKGKKEK